MSTTITKSNLTTTNSTTNSTTNTTTDTTTKTNSPNHTDSSSKIGVTQSIRQKLNFLDDRVWKKFSARRLELIDHLNLEKFKASEQDLQIKRVAETLRAEYGYDSIYKEDFRKLVQAGIQSVRRNRKRTIRREMEEENKRKKMNSNGKIQPGSTKKEEDGFLSEIVRSDDDIYDVNYNKSKKFSTNDHANNTIQNIIKPRPTNQEFFETKKQIELAKTNLLNKIERSKTCNGTLDNLRSNNLQFLGSSLISSCIGYIFEKYFNVFNLQSLEYLRMKVTSQAYLAKVMRDLDPLNIKETLNDEIAVISLYTLVGAITIDFGFDEVMKPLNEIFHGFILDEYPLINKNLTSIESNDNFSLNKLAEVATKLQDERKQDYDSSSNSIMSVRLSPTSSRHSSNEPPINKKSIKLKFLNETVEFFYPLSNSAIPKYYEFVENIKNIFKLNSNCILEIKFRDSIIQNDQDLEKSFKLVHISNSQIEFKISTKPTIPIQFFTSDSNSVRYTKPESTTINTNPHHKIFLPPPIPSATINPSSNSFTTPFFPISNSIDISENKINSLNEPPILPKFQPLL
ncbi:uncharacterized protein KGF55_002448 [Candida pseudojiufengensis]|uniref:uncharacterized protein n=1 Tax=Candida pseudojiufengensis TaxID=497109 RepID=UPI00222570DC|nr:uncharacterized protein KGF55_002448 [Candida pseudojiufengensis]KAI5963568.1 hypothetical protein KGF55_002448 [Candida pseudojiufengensis]